MGQFNYCILVDEIAEKSSELIATYEDHDGLFRKDVQAMSGAGIDDALEEFYDRLKGLKDFYRDLPNELLLPFDPSAANASALDEGVSFCLFGVEMKLVTDLSFLSLGVCFRTRN